MMMLIQRLISNVSRLISLLEWGVLNRNLIEEAVTHAQRRVSIEFCVTMEDRRELNFLAYDFDYLPRVGDIVVIKTRDEADIENSLHKVESIGIRVTGVTHLCEVIPAFRKTGKNENLDRFVLDCDQHMRVMGQEISTFKREYERRYN